MQVDVYNGRTCLMAVLFYNNCKLGVGGLSVGGFLQIFTSVLVFSQRVTSSDLVVNTVITSAHTN